MFDLTWCHKSFPNTLPICGRHVKSQSSCNMPLCKNLCHLCSIPKATSILQKPMSPCATSQGYANFAKTYVICIIISQATSILQKPMSLVLYPKLCQFCKYLCYLCYIPRLHQFCKNLCHLCYIPSYVNFANTYVTCVTSQGYINFAKTFVTCVISQATSILQNPMTLV